MLLSMEAGDRESACRSTETAILEFSSGNLPKLVPWRDKERVGITVDAEAGGEEDGVPGDPAEFLGYRFCPGENKVDEGVV